MQIKNSFHIALITTLCITLLEQCKKTDNPTSRLATVTTDAVAGISANSATVSGTVTNDGGSGVTARGICFGTNSNPTINSFVAGGIGTGSFSAPLTGLTPNTTYFVRAFATNTDGTSYGNQLSFTTTPPLPIDSATMLFVGGFDTLYALNAKTGVLKWKVRLSGHITSPAYSNGVVFINDYAGKVYAYDTAGVLKWTALTANPSNTYSPVINNNIIVVKDNNGILYAYNENNGTLKWQKATGTTGFTVANATIYTSVASSNALCAYDLQTGNLKWTSLASQGFPPPIIRNNKIYIAGNNHDVAVVNESNGSIIWRRDISDLFPSAINVGHGNIYLVSENHWIKAIDSATGANKWQVNSVYFGSALYYYAAAFPVVTDSLAIMSMTASIKGYEPSTGAIKVDMSGDFTSGVTIVNKIMYAGTYNFGDGRISARSLVNPNDNWTSSFKAPFNNSTPCVVTKSGKMWRGGDVY
jgi:outer membrane protein assembly factor BamB